MGYSAFHDFHLDEQGNWAEHKDGAGTTLVSPTIAKDNAYTAWPVSGGSTLSFVLDDTGRFVYERPVAGGGKYLYKHDGLGRLVSAQRISVPGKADLTTTYGYTADGRLAWRKEGAAAREWLIYDGSQAVVQTTDSALSWTHVWAGSRLAAPVAPIRRFIRGARSRSEGGIPAGSPSRIPTSTGPCDSPAVRYRRAIRPPSREKTAGGRTASRTARGRLGPRRGRAPAVDGRGRTRDPAPR